MEDSALGVLDALSRLRADSDAAASAREESQIRGAAAARNLQAGRRTLLALTEQATTLNRRKHGEDELSHTAFGRLASVERDVHIAEFLCASTVASNAEHTATFVSLESSSFRVATRAFRDNVNTQIAKKKAMRLQLINLNTEVSPTEVLSAVAMIVLPSLTLLLPSLMFLYCCVQADRNRRELPTLTEAFRVLEEDNKLLQERSQGKAVTLVEAKDALATLKVFAIISHHA